MFLMNYDFDPHLLLISIHFLSYSSFFHVSFHCIFPQRELHDSYDFNLNLHYAFFSPACIHLFFSRTFRAAVFFFLFYFSVFNSLLHSLTSGFYVQLHLLVLLVLVLLSSIYFCIYFYCFQFSFFCIDFHANHKFTYLSSKCLFSFSFALIFRQFTLILFIL